ncbi:hypothetical protein ACHAXM_009369 [Skeletonema potamos]
MRVVIQRVKSASVTVDQQQVSTIGAGTLALPDYKKSMKSAEAQIMYNKFLDMLRDGYEPSKIFDGKFGEMMDVGLVNDGPVTIVIDSREEVIGSQTSSMSLSDSDKNS